MVTKIYELGIAMVTKTYELGILMVTSPNISILIFGVLS